MPSRLTLSRRVSFSCGRRLFHPDWSDARNRETFGKESFAHGHDYTLDAFYSAARDDAARAEDGMIVNIADLKPLLALAASSLDGQFLPDDVPHFQAVRPTLPNLVSFLWAQLPPRLGAGTMSRLRLQETSRLWADKTPNQMKITRAYEFAAAHRLHAPQLSDEENARLYGVCNNPRGHGHNFGLEVTLEGEPDAQTGAIFSLPVLDDIVDREIFNRFDHKHLNEDCPDLRGLIPTTETFARVIFEILEGQLKGETYHLAKIGLRETQKNYFEVEA